MYLLRPLFTFWFSRSSFDRLSLAGYQFKERVLISAIINTKMTVYLFVHFFSVISKPIWMHVCTHLLYASGMFLKQHYLRKTFLKMESASQNVLKLLLPRNDAEKPLVFNIILLIQKHQDKEFTIDTWKNNTQNYHGQAYHFNVMQNIEIKIYYLLRSFMSVFIL